MEPFEMRRSHQSTTYLLCSIVVLYAVTVTASVCPSVCICTRKQPFYPPSAYNVENMLYVKCKPIPLLPNLTSLKNDSSEKYLALYRDSLLEIIPKKEDFPRGTKITELSYHYIHLLNIEDDVFENLQQSLRRLDLTSTKFKVRRSVGFLRGLIHLDILDLTYNHRFWGERKADRFGSIFKNLGLEKLRVLKISECDVINMTDNALTGLEGLKELYLDGNLIPSVPRTIRILRNLEVLDLSKNKITTLQGSLFQKNRKLRRLILSENPGLEINFDAFIGLENSLVVLDLKGTGQTVVPTVAVSRLKALKHLNISDNAITEMEIECLKGENCLQELNVEKILDVQFHSRSFEGQTDCIKVISLSPTTVPTAALQSLNELEHINYRYNSEMTTLKSGSFNGVKAKTYIFEELAVKTIEKGAFNGINIPVSLYLRKMLELTNINFVVDYPKGTFKYFYVEDDVPVQCDCNLVGPMDRLECALDGFCVGAYPYYFLDGNDLREKLSTTCPNAPDFTKMWMICSAVQISSMQLIALTLVSLIVVFTVH